MVAFPFFSLYIFLSYFFMLTPLFMVIFFLSSSSCFSEERWVTRVEPFIGGRGLKTDEKFHGLSTFPETLVVGFGRRTRVDAGMSSK